MGRKARDYTGTRIGMLEVVKMSHKVKGRYQWLCQCDCGNTTTVDANNLGAGVTRSCGCLINNREDRSTPIIKNGNRTIVSSSSYHKPKSARHQGWQGASSLAIGG